MQPVKASVLIKKRDCETDRRYFEVTIDPWEAPKKVAGEDGEVADIAVSRVISNSAVVKIEDNFSLSDHLIEQGLDAGDAKVTLQLRSRGTSGDVCLQYLGTSFPLTIRNLKAARLEKAFTLPRKVLDHSALLVAPMPGLVTTVAIKPGDKVTQGQELCVLEAMKMQNSMSAGRSGVVKSVNFERGQAVSEGDVIVELE